MKKIDWFKRIDPEYIPFDRPREEVIDRITKLVAKAKRRASTYEKRVRYKKEDPDILEKSGYYLYTRALNYYRQRREHREGGDFSRFGLGTTKSQYVAFTDRDLQNMETALLKYLNVQTSTYKEYKEVQRKSSITLLKRYGWDMDLHSKQENEIAFSVLHDMKEKKEQGSARILIAIAEEVQGSSTHSYSISDELRTEVKKRLKAHNNIQWTKVDQAQIDSLVERYKKDDYW